MAAGSAPTPAASPVVPGPLVSSASPTPGPPASSSNPATPSPHLSAISTPSDKSAAPKGTKKGSKATTKKVKQTDDTAFTTGRFRLSQYSGTPNDAPPVLHSQGTYASVYRAPVPSVEVTPPGLGLEPSSSPATVPTAAPIPGTRIIMADASPRATKRSSKPQTFQPTQEEPADNNPSHSGVHSVYTVRPPAPHSTQSTTISPPSKNVPRTIPQAIPSAAPVASHPSALQTGYYRRNYEQGSQVPPRPDSSRPPHTPIQMSDSRNIDTTMAPPPAEISMTQSKGKEREASGQRVYQALFLRRSVLTEHR